MKLSYVARNGVNGFRVVTDAGETTVFRSGSKDPIVEDVVLYLVNATNAAIARDLRDARRATRDGKE